MRKSIVFLEAGEEEKVSEYRYGNVCLDFA